MPAQGGHDGVAEERGTAIWYLLVAVVLFGALAYVFLQGSRGNVSMITDEAAKTAAYQSQDCTNAVSMGMKRLQTRGCAGLISLEADGSNPHAGAPADGSCSVYHPNGGGIAPCNVVIAALPEAPLDCTTGPIGTACTSDGAFYIGDIGSNRIYAAPADEGTTAYWGARGVSVGTDNIDGWQNTDNALASITTNPQTGPCNANPYNPPACAPNAYILCRDKAPTGTWYLPTRNELALVWNRETIDLTDKGFQTGSTDWYWSSEEVSSTHSWRLNFGDSLIQSVNTKSNIYLVRCVRR